MPEHIALQIGFDTSEVSQREVVLAEGSRKAVPMIGPLRIYFADRTCDLSALALGDEPLIGAAPIEMSFERQPGQPICAGGARPMTLINGWDVLSTKSTGSSCHWKCG